LARVLALLGTVSEPPEDAERPHGTLRLPPGLGPLQWCQRRYLERRGFDPDHLAKFWGVQGIGLEGVTKGLPWRIFIPITRHGQTVSWTARTSHSVSVQTIVAQ